MTMPKRLDRTAADDSISAYGAARSTINETPLKPNELLRNQQIACEKHAYEFGVDRPDITDWQWPF